MDEKGLLFLTAKITVVDISQSRDIASIAMKAVEKKKKVTIDKSSIFSTKSANDFEGSETSEEDERGGIELLDTFKHFVKALDVNKP